MQSNWSTSPRHAVNLVGGHAVSGALLAAAGATTAAATPRLDGYRSSPAYRRVLIVAPQPFYEDRGTPIAVRQVVEGLSQLGYSVDLLTYPIGSDIQVPGVRLMRTANPFRFKSVPVGLSLKKILLDIPLTLALLSRLRTGAYSCIH